MAPPRVSCPRPPRACGPREEGLGSCGQPTATGQGSYKVDLGAQNPVCSKRKTTPWSGRSSLLHPEPRRLNSHLTIKFHRSNPSVGSLPDTEAGVAAQPVATTMQERLRTKIQALRTISVTLAVVCRLWPNRLTSGHVGVDLLVGAARTPKLPWAFVLYRTSGTGWAQAD